MEDNRLLMTRDSEAELQNQLKIREIHDSIPGKIDKAITQGELQHLENLRKIEWDRQHFIDKVEEMKEKDQKAHEDLMAEAEMRKRAKLEAVSKDLEFEVQSSLDNIEEELKKTREQLKQLEDENQEHKIRMTEMEVEAERRLFDELNAEKEKNELFTEKCAEEIINKSSLLHSEEQKIMTTERAERQKNDSLAIAEIKSEIVDQISLGMLNLSIQQATDDRKNRRQINSKIMELKTLSLDLDQIYMRAAEVLGASPEQYAKIKTIRKKKTKNHLTRFTEILDAINIKISEIEQTLASLELPDVEMTEISQNIKTQISSFGRAIPNLKLTLDLDGFNIDPEKTKEFTIAKDALFEQINKMERISEKRQAIVKSIQARQIETMPTVGTFSIES